MINVEYPGPNSCFISYEAETDVGEIYDAMMGFITGHGWDVVDTVAERDIVISAPVLGSPLFPKIARLSLSGTAITLNVYEAWNEATHVGVNVGYDNTGLNAINIDTTNNGYMVISCNARALILYPYKAEVSAGFRGVFEISRDEEDDTDDYPRYAYAYNGGIIGGKMDFYNATGGSSNNNPSHFRQISPPRLIDLTSSTAYSCTRVSNALGQPTFDTNYSLTNTVTIDGEEYKLCLPWHVYYYSTTPVFNKSFVSSYRKGPMNATFTHIGRLHNIHTTHSNVGQNLETIEIPINEDGFFDKDGTNTKHLIFALNGLKTLVLA